VGTPKRGAKERDVQKNPRGKGGKGKREGIYVTREKRGVEEKKKKK